MLNTPRRLVNENSLTCWYLLKASWRRLCKTSWRCLEDVFARRLVDVLKTSWRGLGKTSWRCLEDVFKTSWRGFEDVLEDVLKTSLRCLGRASWRHLEGILKTYLRRLEDVFWRRMTKANIFVLVNATWKRLGNVFWRRRRKTSSRRLHGDKCLLGYFLQFVGILRTLILRNSLQLASTGCQDSLIRSR